MVEVTVQPISGVEHDHPPRLPDVGALLLRAVLGVVFVAHGLSKVGNLDGTAQHFDELGIPAATLMAPLATFTEIVGGGLLILGLLAPLAGLALAATMAVALVAQHLSSGFFAADGGYEYVLVLGIASFAVAAIGPGRLSLDAARTRLAAARPAAARSLRQPRARAPRRSGG